MHHELKDAINDACSHERERLKQELAKVLGYEPGTESQWIGTWSDLLKIVKVHREQLSVIKKTLL